MKVKAHAKINLCLNVVGKRADGYHELEMIMVPLTLHDVISIDLAKEDVFTCSDENVVMDGSNTVVKAVEVMRSHFSVDQHFHIHVDKKIPAQAGLAGGSADGAAVLRAIASLCHLNTNLDELAQLGKQIGADVPFCVKQTCAVVKGIGEIIEPFSIHCPFSVLLVKPKEGVSTPKAFSMLDFDQCDHPDYEKVKQCLMLDQYDRLSDVIANSLEYSAFQMVPFIKEIKNDLKQRGFDAVLMSGSGSTVFALTRDEQLLKNTLQSYQKKDLFVCKCKILEEPAII